MTRQRRQAVARRPRRRQQRRVVGQAVRRVPRTRRARNGNAMSGSLVSSTGRTLWHPVFSTHSWVPRSLALTPTIRVRETTTYTAGLITGAAFPLGIVIGPGTTTAAGDRTVSTGGVGRFGAGATVGTGGTAMATTLASTLPLGRVRLHRLAVTVSCLGPTAVGVLLPSSHIRIGVLRNPLDARNYATWNDVTTHLASKSELHSYTAYSLMMKPCHAASYPLDVRAWEMLHEVDPVYALATTEIGDELATIAILISTSATLDQYCITVHSDWDVLPSDDAAGAAILSSAAVHQPSLPETVINAAISGAQAVHGVFEAGLELVGKAANTVTSLANMYAAVPQATRAMPMIGTLRSPLALTY